jgi:hypothetical protein
MSRRDDLHFPVRRALEKEGWTITSDPLLLRFQEIQLQADIGAEMPFGAEKDGWKIAVEVKDFDTASFVNELEKMIGQMQLYQLALDERETDRELFLAVSLEMYDWQYRKRRSAFRAVVERNKINLIVFDEIEEVIRQWIRR